MHTLRSPSSASAASRALLVLALLASFPLGAGCDEGGGGPRDDAGSNPGPDAGPDPDPDAGPAFGVRSTTIGTLDEAASRISAVPYATFVSEMLGAVQLSDGATAALIVDDAPVVVPTTPLGPGAALQVTASDGARRTYALAFETLTNTTVLVAGGTRVRFTTRYFPNGPNELIVLDVDGNSHHFLAADLVSGVYGPTNAAHLGLELEGPEGGPTLVGGSYAEPGGGSATVTLTISASAIVGHYEGELELRGRSSPPVPLVGWFHSDRIDSGGW